MSRLAAAALVALTACRAREAAPAGEPSAPPRDAAIDDAAGPAREPWRCAVADEPAAPEETFTTGGRSWQLAGGVLTVASAAANSATASGAAANPATTSHGAAANPATAGAAANPATTTAGAAANPAASAAAPERPAAAAGGPSANAGERGAGDVMIGVIADAAGSSPATLAALRRLRARFGTPDLVVVLGGMGSTAAELDAVFAALGDRATWPVVAMPGDLEAVPAQAEAIAAARGRAAVVIDGRRVQRIELGGVTIGLVPGAGATARLVAGASGCRYERAGIEAVLASLAARPGLRVLATAEAPRGDGDPPTGERAITASPGVIDVALHGGSDVATPARSGRRDGSATALTPGSADALPRLTRRYRRPTAGLLRVRGSTWNWQPLGDLR